MKLALKLRAENRGLGTGASTRRNYVVKWLSLKAKTSLKSVC